jgi:hypothetical protein
MHRIYKKVADWDGQGAADVSDQVFGAKDPHLAARETLVLNSHGPGRPGRLRALRVFHSDALYGVFVWARRGLNSPFRRFSVRADENDARLKGEMKYADEHSLGHAQVRQQDTSCLYDPI